MLVLTTSPNHVTPNALDTGRVKVLTQPSDVEGVAIGMMKISWSGLFRRRSKASTAEQKADHLIAGDPESEVRRNACGSIDIAFYTARAQRLRREAALELCHSIREFSHGWF